MAQMLHAIREGVTHQRNAVTLEKFKGRRTIRPTLALGISSRQNQAAKRREHGQVNAQQITHGNFLAGQAITGRNYILTRGKPEGKAWKGIKMKSKDLQIETI
jgi:hypothetical protein